MVTLVSQENMVALVSRTGRHLQRYCMGRRQVVGCIPYRYSEEARELEVLVISSQKGNRMLFPKGGWEIDESKIEAASRETVEEAGVRGIIELELGKWSFKSKTHDTYYDGYMFPLRVREQLDFWPEQKLRQRKWMSVQEAREVCEHWWMKDALDKFVSRLTSQQRDDHEEVGHCSLS
ncbi:hypothetical protein FH972_007796 [Carpinus fangiana]|uniref:Nudix hydrolase domain-containing protein n=1 Tax=Carpinus fangiana TaxID=176857 RepID=A0A5N6QWN9_9ROSI|nr:hypothetical protein FH972_007796 [Carpinus fangiana]